MKKTVDMSEHIGSGETASVENAGPEKLSVSFVCSNGCRLDMDLMPGQVVEFTAGSSDARIILHGGDPASLFIVKPESAS